MLHKSRKFCENLQYVCFIIYKDSFVFSSLNSTYSPLELNAFDTTGPCSQLDKGIKLNYDLLTPQVLSKNACATCKTFAVCRQKYLVYDKLYNEMNINPYLNAGSTFVMPKQKPLRSLKVKNNDQNLIFIS